MADTSANNMEQPKTNAQKASGPEPRIFNMPAKYRHGAEVKMSAPQKAEQPKLVKPPAPPKPKAPPAPPKKPQMGKPIQTSKSKTTKLLMIVGGVLVLVLAIGGYLVARSTGQQSNEPAPVVTTTPPKPPVTEEEPEVVEEESEEEQQQESDPFAEQRTPGIDSDSDGLTDLEEQLIYSTNPQLPDTDSDGFLDGNEVFHRYDPNGTTSGSTLLSSGVVTKKVTEGFSFVYPTAWQSSDNPNTEEKPFFTLRAPSGESFAFTYMKREVEVSFKEQLTDPFVPQTYIESATKNGFPMLIQELEGATVTAAVDLGSHAVEIQYQLEAKIRADYLQTLKMIMNSIELVETPETEVVEEPEL